MRKLLFNKSRGSVESFITVIPQVFIFLVMFQLIFMQFSVMRDSNLSQGEVARAGISGDNGEFERYQLIGGGSLLVVNKQKSLDKFIDFNYRANKKTVAVAFDEESIK